MYSLYSPFQVSQCPVWPPPFFEQGSIFSISVDPLGSDRYHKTPTETDSDVYQGHKQSTIYTRFIIKYAIDLCRHTSRGSQFGMLLGIPCWGGYQYNMTVNLFPWYTFQTLANLDRSSGVRNSHTQTIQSKGRQSRLHSSVSTESWDCMIDVDSIQEQIYPLSLSISGVGAIWVKGQHRLTSPTHLVPM
jgi:hypothetical protein